MSKKHETFDEHARAEHPRSIWYCVRNLSGTAYICCVGECDWSVGLRTKKTT